MEQIHASELASGWCYSNSGKPVAYVMHKGQPHTTTCTEFSNWWSAMNHAIEYATRDPWCQFVGGPEV